MTRELLSTWLSTLWVFQPSEFGDQAVEVSTKAQSNHLVYGGEAKDHEPRN